MLLWLVWLQNLSWKMQVPSTNLKSYCSHLWFVCASGWIAEIFKSTDFVLGVLKICVCSHTWEKEWVPELWKAYPCPSVCRHQRTAPGASLHLPPCWGGVFLLSLLHCILASLGASRIFSSLQLPSPYLYVGVPTLKMLTPCLAPMITQLSIRVLGVGHQLWMASAFFLIHYENAPTMEKFQA